MALYEVIPNNSSNCSNVHRIGEHSRVNIILYVSVGSLVSSLIVVGNLLIIASIVKFRHLRTTSNILIANLAVSDLMVGLFLVPLNIIVIALPHLQDNKYVCLARMFNWLYTFGSCLLNLCLISIDRLFAIGKPMRYRSFDSRTVAIVCCLVTWLAWTAMGILLFGPLNTWQCNKSCIVPHVLSKYSFQILAVVGGFAFLFSSGAFMVIVGFMLKLKNRRIDREVTDTKNKTGVMVLVFGMFMIFFIPLVFIAVYTSIAGIVDEIVAVEWLILIGTLNSVVNSAIYGWKRREFRRAYHRILTCSQNQDRIHPIAIYHNPPQGVVHVTRFTDPMYPVFKGNVV